MKKIVITELEDGSVSLKSNKGTKWSTFITGIEMMIEVIKDNAEIEINIDKILDDVKRIYERDRSN